MTEQERIETSEWRKQYRRELVAIDSDPLALDPGARRHNRHAEKMQQAYLGAVKPQKGEPPSPSS